MTSKSPAPSPSTRVLVWDLPTRLLHWTLAGSFASAFVVASVADEHSPSFVVHMLLGAIAAIAVVLRVAWGFVGSRYARFRSFAFGPGSVVSYLRGVFRGEGERHRGHNPANAWAAFAMFALLLGDAATGALIARGGHVVKDVHAVLVYAMVAVVAAHLAGLALQAIRRRENVAIDMVDGKQVGDPAHAIASAHPVAAVAAIGLLVASAAVLVRGYDPATRRLTLPGVGPSLELGNAEEGDRDRRGGRGRDRHHDD